MRTYDWTYEKRALWRFFEVNDYKRTQPGEKGAGSFLETHVFPTDRARYEAWFYDSMLYAIEEIERGDLIQAFRGYTQAAQYSGKLETSHDTLTGLKNYFEDTIRSLVLERDTAMQVLHDKFEDHGVPWPARRLR